MRYFKIYSFFTQSDDYSSSFLKNNPTSLKIIYKNMKKIVKSSKMINRMKDLLIEK